MSANKYVMLSTSSPSVQVDPAAPGTFIRYAMAIEGSLNILGGISMLAMPAKLLGYMTTSPLEVTDSAVSLIQWLGALTLGLTPQLFLAIPNTRAAMESRRMVYYTLGAGELALIPLFIWQASKSDGETGITSKALIVAMSNLLPPLLLRGYVLFVKPSLMGRYRDVNKSD